MTYQGSKRRIAHLILPLMLKHRGERAWVEPFVGGGNMIEHVVGERIANDQNIFVIKCLEALSKGWVPPISCTEQEYKRLQELYRRGAYKDQMEEAVIIGWALTQWSFGAKWCGGFTRYEIPRMATRSREAVDQGKRLARIKFHSGAYDGFKIPPLSLIYCDPPYQGTMGYKDGLNYDKFWQWCRDLVKQGHQVYVSEYSAPDDFKAVWEGVQTTSTNNKDAAATPVIERLYVHESVSLDYTLGTR